MPFYEYVCTACGRETEVLQRISDPPETECPNCHAQALVKQVSAAGFRLKGGGWYETDFKNGSKRNVAGDSGEAKPSGDSAAPAADSGSDSKSHGCAAGACGCAPAAKPAAKPVATSSTPSASTTPSST